MSCIYICVYRFDRDAGRPYDTGDDPSFKCSNEHRSRGGVLTWGVCRADVRNAIHVDDVVVFFGAKRGDQPMPYRFSGFATVARKITQEEIWRKKQLAVYRNYTNLLIRPTRRGFEHCEPAFLPPSESRLQKTGELTGGAFSQEDPLPKMFREKLAKTYSTGGAQLDLLLYYSKQFPHEQMPMEYLKVHAVEIANLIRNGPFSRVWIYSDWCPSKVLWQASR